MVTITIKVSAENEDSLLNALVDLIDRVEQKGTALPKTMIANGGPRERAWTYEANIEKKD
jgi:hypothetical protein